MKTIVIQGSSRSRGNTNTIIRHFQDRFNSDFIDLNDLTIQLYNYSHAYTNDDFITTMKKIVHYDLIIFATPVYWYSMSGIMKVFFDRITDCLRVEKELGRALRGKQMAVISCGSGPMESEPFFMPFKQTAEYLGMTYAADVHAWIEKEDPDEEVIELIDRFISKLEAKKYAEIGSAI